MASRAPIRVALCDDHAVVRAGLRLVLESEEDLAVVGEAGTAEAAVELARLVRPDVFVMDVGLPDASGVVATARVREASPTTRVVILTVHDDVAYLRRAFDAGADGYLVKDAADVDLVHAVRTVAGGRQYVHPTLGAELLESAGGPQRVRGPGGELSEREVDVLRLVALGHTNAAIAKELFISVRTVETHRAHIGQKLGARSRAELVEAARQAGLLGEEAP